jgi:hypothetical protein
MGPNPASANLSDRLVASVAQAGSARTTPGLYRELLRLLSRGEPVTIAGLAGAAGYPTDEANGLSLAGTTLSTTHKAASLAGD